MGWEATFPGSGNLMLHLAMLLLVSAAVAEPDPVPPDPLASLPATAGAVVGVSDAGSDPVVSQAFDGVLREAKQRYFQGESQVARELLQGLQLRLYAGEEADWNAIVDALTYLGEILYVQGDQDQAEIAFRYLLERDPNTPISPYHHKIEVVNLFELVRTTVIASRLDELPPPLPIDRLPVPAWTFLPLGAPQVLQGRTGVGLVYGGLQVGFGTASIALQVHTKNLNPKPRDLVGNAEEVAANRLVVARVNQMRYLYQWPSTFAFYGLWAVSVIDAATWHQRHGARPPRTSIEATLAPTPAGGPGVMLFGKF